MHFSFHNKHFSFHGAHMHSKVEFLKKVVIKSIAPNMVILFCYLKIMSTTRKRPG